MEIILSKIIQNEFKWLLYDNEERKRRNLNGCYKIMKEGKESEIYYIYFVYFKQENKVT